MRSKLLHAVDDPQRALPLAKPQPVDSSVVHAQRSLSASIKLAGNVSGLDEKQIYRELDIDPGHWTRIMNGDANFPIDKLEQFMDLVGNEIPLQWLAHRRGKGLHLLLSEAERQLHEERSARVAAESRLAYLEGLVTQR